MASLLVAFPTTGADTVNIPALIAHEYGHAKQRWLEVDDDAAKALRGDLDRLITNHKPTLRTLTARSFEYEPASLIPREVFAELYAARHVLDLADGGKLAEDLVHPALRDPAMQPVLAEFERILTDATP